MRLLRYIHKYTNVTTYNEVSVSYARCQGLHGIGMRANYARRVIFANLYAGLLEGSNTEEPQSRNEIYKKN